MCLPASAAATQIAGFSLTRQAVATTSTSSARTALS
jgi:hypothetical protein